MLDPLVGIGNKGLCLFPKLIAFTELRNIAHCLMQRRRKNKRESGEEEGLPVEIWAEILGHIAADPNEALCARAVSSTWNKILREAADLDSVIEAAELKHNQKAEKEKAKKQREFAEKKAWFFFEGSLPGYFEYHGKEKPQCIYCCLVMPCCGLYMCAAGNAEMGVDTELSCCMEGCLFCLSPVCCLLCCPCSWLLAMAGIMNMDAIS